MHLYISSHVYQQYVCLKCRGRVVTNVVRTCDPTQLLYIFGNKICLNCNYFFHLALLRLQENLMQILACYREALPVGFLLLRCSV